MNKKVVFVAVLLTSLLLAACSSSPEQVTARVFGGAAQSIEGFQRADSPLATHLPRRFRPSPRIPDGVVVLHWQSRN